MATRRKIVYPDGDDATRDLLTGERLARIEILGDFTLYPDIPGTTDDYLQRIGDAEAIFLGWNLPDEVLSQAPKLKIVAFTGIGAANFVNLEMAARQGITVTNTPGYANETVAEHTLGLMLATARQLTRLDRDTRQGGWNKGLPAFDLKGKTLGLIGLGGIGTRTAHLARAFGMRVIAWTPNPSPERAASAGIEFKHLDQVLSQCDVLSLHLALTPDTENMLDSERLAKMKHGAMLINTARAEIIDEKALISALESGAIGAAGLDVFHEEPLPSNHPFRSLDNVVVTPHTGFNTPDATAAIIDIAVESMEAYFSGKPVNVVAAPG
ncbi:MAG: glycerate dehydrogenase [Alphaproteobacteria bacterium]|nr:glycerate dehydrogenase [Alphaproteobacteria bacterium]